ncbi:TIGR03943 family protein [Streptomyces sp. NBC_00287]|uniref:TIGR03943 family putative permease subunit n=1 Tax=Streptomyces sp. NBC_00287 TaxID=2975702 RepID=UPI002E29B17A|nr:TIGR03943 family protein [Streptomyces sp. NBC_00287]
MKRQAQAAILFLLGASLLHAGTTDLYLRYVKSGLRPLLLLSAAILMAAALATAWYERKSPTPSHHPEPRVSWLLTLPLLALILVAPPALGSYSALRTGTALQEPLGYPELPPTDPLPMALTDYAGRAVYDEGRSLKNRRVEITGFVALSPSGTPYLVRMTLNCCAADAQPVKIALTGEVPPVLRPDTWLRVTGTYTPRTTKDPVNGAPIPFLKVTEATPTKAPKDPYDETWNT